MPQYFALRLSLFIAFLSSAIPFNSAFSQVTSDGTLSTTVNNNGNEFKIENGARAGNNLFHSFRDFSVLNGNTAFFNNNLDVVNIINRVTGGNISNIDGLLKANGSANLYLINPAGIIFGENASLDIGGSFYGSTADSISFPDGEFSATDLDNPPLLTINAPIGFNLRDNPEDIINRSTFVEESSLDGENSGDFDFPNTKIPVGLKVQEGQSITLEGGNIIFDGGLATAPGGEITLNTTENIEIISNSFLDKPLDTSLNPGDGGAITLNSSGGNITITNSTLSSDSAFESFDFENNNGGNITIAANQSVFLTNSLITSTTNSLEGRGGNLIINAGSSIRLEDTRIDAANFGNGRSGDITIEALNGGNVELIGTQTEQIDIFDNSSELDGAGVIFTDAFGSGEGLVERQTGGNLTITGGSITIDNYNLISRVNRFSDDIFLPNSNTQGNAGDISITGDLIVIENNSSLITATLGEGNAGNINLNATNISLSNGVELNTQTESNGSAGIVNITADSLILDRSSIEASNLPSQLASGQLFGGNINLNLTQNLFLFDDSTISAEANQNANGGNINIGAKFIVAFPSQVNGNDIIANATLGRGGVIRINAESIFNIQESSQISLDNDINASSNIDGLDGTVAIDTPEVGTIQRTTELTTNAIDADEIPSNNCAIHQNSNGNSLIVKGKGGIAPEITEPFIAEDIHINGRYITAKTIPKKYIITPPTNSKLTDANGKEIIPARGIVFRENGEVSLVPYPTPNTTSRNFKSSVNCRQ
jgi:filamentous hemagglutinin family protein